MSPKRQAHPAVAVTQLGDGSGFSTHEHPLHQLAWTDGTLRIDANGALWLLGRGTALWIPAGVAHRALAVRATTMKSLYFRPATCPIRWAIPTAVRTTGVARHVLAHLLGGPTGAERERAEAFVFDLLEPLAEVVGVPEPEDDRLRTVAAALHEAPADARTLADWGLVVGASGRTLSRLVERETGMGFNEWRTHLRVAHAARRLAAGEAVGRVAHDVGYSTPSAFVAAFRRVVGMTPRAYAAQPHVDHVAAQASDVVHIRPGVTVDLRGTVFA
jgi:AraC-like DNA-binding protein